MELAILQSEIKTMSSREIATLTSKEHKNVLADIRNMFEQLEIDELGFQHIYLDSMNREQTEYLLNKDLSITLVSGYNVKMRHAIVVRWQELESSQSLALPNFTDPAEAAIAWANEYKAKQALQIELKQAEPKINHYDKVVARKQTLLNATQVAQKLEKTAYWLNPHLEILKVYNGTVKRGRAFAQWFIDKGFGVMKQTDNGFSQPLFTLTGEAWVIETLTNEGIA